MRLVLIKSMKTFICVALFFALFWMHGEGAWAVPSEELHGQSESLAGAEYVHLDISEGRIVISEDGYTIGDMEEAVPFSGVYYITGTAPDGVGIVIESGVHTVLIKDLVIDQRTEDDCCPIEIGPKTKVDLNINGDTVLYAGSGRGGIELSEDAALDMNVYGEGSLSIMAYPEWRVNRVCGSQAIYVPLSASIDYPYGEDDDQVEMYCGVSRREYKRVYVYSGQMFMNIEFDMQDKEHVVSQDADCLNPQICLQCAKELHVETDHMVTEHATCTQAGLCSVCAKEVEEPAGHKGAWRVLGYSPDGVWRQETLVCKICKEVLTRQVKVK